MPATRIVPLPDVVSTTGDPDLQNLRGAAITIGNFDGVHAGHQSLLRQLTAMSDRLRSAAVVVTFDPHPAAVLRPGDGPTPLTDMTTRAHLMSKLGIAALVVIQTTPELLSLSAEEFYQHLVADRLDAAGIVEGPNFYFGRDRVGNVQLLDQWCRRDGREFRIADATDDGGRMVSSSRIRSAIGSGDVARAAEMMGRPHRVIGTVGHGDARGRTIGFPTANLTDIDVVIPVHGVYAGTVTIGDQTHAAAIHIGPNVTFGQTDDRVEVHVLDFDGDLYDRSLAVDVAHRVRDISRFDSADDLVRQLTQDVQRVRDIIGLSS